MGVGAGLYMYVVVVQKFTFAISSPDEFLLCSFLPLYMCIHFSVSTVTCTFVTCFIKYQSINQSSGPKSGRLLCPVRCELGPHPTQCSMGRGLPPYTKWHPNPSNPLATIHQRYRQDRQTDKTRQADRQTTVR